jgi:uncharacterized protein
MSEEKQGKTWAFDVCSSCSLVCCKDANPPLTTNRKDVISEFLKQQGISISHPFVNEEYSHPAVDREGFCQFYNKETRKCMVHSVKPETCRAGPVTFDINFKTRKLEFYLKKGSICAFARVLYKNKSSLEKHLVIAKEEILQLIQMLDVTSLQAVLRIPEPQTFKIDETELPQEVIKKLGIN